MSKINKALISAFAAIDSWFDQPETILKQRSANNDWSPAEILEYILLTNHFLLELIENGGERAISMTKGKDITQKILDCMMENKAMEEDVEAGFLPWDSLAHVRQAGVKPLNEIRETLREQLYRCMCQLDLLHQRQGLADQINMPENGPDKADLCQYIYFLALHVKRHVTLLEKYAPCQSESGPDSVCV